MCGLWTGRVWRGPCPSGHPMVDGSGLVRPACRLCDRGCYRMTMIRFSGNRAFPYLGSRTKYEYKDCSSFLSLSFPPSNNVRSTHYQLPPCHISNRHHSCPRLHSDRGRARCTDHSPDSFPPGSCRYNVRASCYRKQSSSYKSLSTARNYLWSMAIACRRTTLRPSAVPLHKSPHFHSGSQ